MLLVFEIRARQMLLLSKISAKISPFLTLENLGDECAKCLSEFFKFNRGPNL